jgi:hypothetical protein
MAKDESKPFQFYLPQSLRVKGLDIASKSGVPMSQFMLMAWEQFCNRPIEESLRRLRVHKKKKSTKKKGVTLKV